MSNNKGKADLAAAVAEAAGVSKSSADKILTEAFATIRDWTVGGASVSIAGFGKFSEKARAARTGRNPRTGETVQIPAKAVLIFKPTKPKAA